MTVVPVAADDAGYPTVFREFLYADLERTRSLFAQRLGGVPEEDRVTDSALQHYALGVQRYLGIGKESKTEHFEQRSLLDALFPALETLLEVEGWLTDISDVVHDSTDTDADRLHNLIEPGSIIRMTADGTLFDSEYFARILAGMSVAAGGIAGFMPTASGDSSASPKQKPKGQRGKPSLADEPREARLEDLIEDFPPAVFGGLSADYLRSMVRVARGMFADGLHLLLETDGSVGWTATARLQKGRQHLDAEPDVLFSRYGTSPLEWTIVGTLGHFSEPHAAARLDNLDFMNPDGTVSRTKFVAGLNALTSLLASQGFADSPPFPGFSIVPLAVYRPIPRAGP